MCLVVSLPSQEVDIDPSKFAIGHDKDQNTFINTRPFFLSFLFSFLHSFRLSPSLLSMPHEVLPCAQYFFSHVCQHNRIMIPLCNLYNGIVIPFLFGNPMESQCRLVVIFVMLQEQEKMFNEIVLSLYIFFFLHQLHNRIMISLCNVFIILNAQRKHTSTTLVGC